MVGARVLLTGITNLQMSSTEDIIEWVLAIVQKILPIPYLRIVVSPNKDIILAVIHLGVTPGNHPYVSLPEFESLLSEIKLIVLSSAIVGA